MEIETVAVVLLGLLGYTLVSERIAASILTAPMLFVAFGAFIGDAGIGLINLPMSHELIQLIAEFTLILVLFNDASRIDLTSLRGDHNLPTRMLLLGFPLVLVAGTGVGLLLFPSLSFAEAALLAAILAPTDAALVQAVVSDRAVPMRIRQALNVESGLNDGIALPVVLLFATAASVSESAERNWAYFGFLQVSLGPIVGIAIGWLGGRAIDYSSTHGGMTEASRGAAILAVAILCFCVAEWIGGNGFISAFVGGLVFGNSVRDHCRFLLEFMETEGELLMLATFLLFGAVLLPEGLPLFCWSAVLYAVLSLTLIRMLPIALSLLGSGARLSTTLFLGWFGPRGLASILFVLLILEGSDVAASDTILAVTIVTVTLSIVFHGASAAPLAQRFASAAPGKTTAAREDSEAAELPLRSGH